MKKILFISSLSHSGSTLLDLIIGGHSRFIGLGEIALFIETFQADRQKVGQKPCSCGKTIDTCPFWGNVIARLRTMSEVSSIKAYKIVFEVFSEMFGDSYIPVDSSKYLKNIKFLDANFMFNIQVLHLMKDVRAFTISQIDNATRKGRKNPQFASYKLFKSWHSQNKKTQCYLSKRNIPSMQIGYEELCLYTSAMIPKICNFLNVDFEPSMLEINESKSHIVLGNRMRTQTDKQTVLYDSRWFARHEWEVPALLFRNIMKFNTSNVYSNDMQAIWKK